MTCSGCHTFFPIHFPLCRLCWTSLQAPPPIVPPLAPFISIHARYLLTDPRYRIIREWKKNGGYLLKRAILRDLQAPEVDAIIPIPQDFFRAWRRHGSRTWECAKALHAPIIDALVRTDKTPQAQKTSLFDRISNPPRFKLKDIKLPKRILLVDDIMTTGSTLQAAASALTAYELHAFVLGIRPQQRYEPPKTHVLDHRDQTAPKAPEV